LGCFDFGCGVMCYFCFDWMKEVMMIDVEFEFCEGVEEVFVE